MKWKPTEPLRYSGSELSELLDEVVARHGADVTIESVNRVRTGGIAGFFCKEEFEILVEPSPLEPLEPEPGRHQSTPNIAAARAAAVAENSVDLRPPTPSPPLPPEPPRRGRLVDTARPLTASPQAPVGEAMLDQNLDKQAKTNDKQAKNNGVPFDPVVAPDDSPDPIPEPVPFGGPQPSRFASVDPSGIDLDGGHPHEAGLGSTILDPEVRALRAQAFASSATGEERVEINQASRPEAQSTPVPIVLGRDVITPAAPKAPAPASSAAGVRRMADATPIAPAIEAAMLLTESQARTSPFWLELYRTQRELASFMPLASPFVAVIGTLPQAMVVTRRLRQGPTMAEAGVYVLTDRAGIVSEPMWNLVRSGRRMLEIAAQRAEEPTILIVDVPDEHPNWLFPLQNRLRMAGVSLFHYVVNGRPTAQDLEVFRQGVDLPYAIDLVSRMEPQQVLAFIEHRHPIASVSGTALTAEFLVAMRRQVAGQLRKQDSEARPRLRA